MEKETLKDVQESFGEADAGRGRGGSFRGRGGSRYTQHGHFIPRQLYNNYNFLEPGPRINYSQFATEAPPYGFIAGPSLPPVNSIYPNYTPYHPRPSNDVVHPNYPNSSGGPTLHPTASWEPGPGSDPSLFWPNQANLPSSAAGYVKVNPHLNPHWTEKTKKFIEENERATDIVKRSCRCKGNGPRCSECRSRSRSRTQSRSQSRSYTSRSRSSTRSRSYSSRSYSGSSSRSRSSYSSMSRSRTPSPSKKILSPKKSGTAESSRSRSSPGFHKKTEESEDEEDRDDCTIKNTHIEKDFLDLSKELKPLTDFVHDKKLLLQEAVRSLGGEHLQAVIPSELKTMNLDDLEDECLLILKRLDTDTLLNIMNGKLNKKHIEATNDSDSEYEVTNSSSKSKRTKKSKKQKRKLKKKSKHKMKRKEKRKKKENVPSEILFDPAQDPHVQEKVQILEKEKGLEKSLMDLLEMECRAKAIKALLLSKGLDASKIDNALDVDRDLIAAKKSNVKENLNSHDGVEINDKSCPSSNNLAAISSTWTKSRRMVASTTESMSEYHAMSQNGQSVSDAGGTSGSKGNETNEAVTTAREPSDSILIANKSIDSNTEQSSESDYESKREAYSIFKSKYNPQAQNAPRTYRTNNESSKENENNDENDDVLNIHLENEDVLNIHSESENILNIHSEDEDVLNIHAEDFEAIEGLEKEFFAAGTTDDEELNSDSGDDSKSQMKRRRSWKGERCKKLRKESNDQIIASAEHLEESIQIPEINGDRERSPVEYISFYGSPTKSSDSSVHLEEDFGEDVDQSGRQQILGCKPQPKSDNDNITIGGEEIRDSDIQSNNAPVDEMTTNENPKTKLDSVEEEDTLKTDDISHNHIPETWFERWYNNGNTQKALKTNKLQKKIRMKLKTEKDLEKQKEKVTVQQIVEPLQQPVVGTVEEYKILFQNSKQITSQHKESVTMEQDDKEEDDGLWEEIIQSD